jgi:hypothetical protein
VKTEYDQVDFGLLGYNRGPHTRVLDGPCALCCAVLLYLAFFSLLHGLVIALPRCFIFRHYFVQWLLHYYCLKK